MFDLQYVPHSEAALRAADAALVIMPQSGPGWRNLADLLPANLVAGVKTLATVVSVGDMGGLATTSVDAGKIGRLHLALLPERGSRYNSPVRAEAIRRAVKATPKPARCLAILLVIEAGADAEARGRFAANAVAKALPMLSLKSNAGAARKVKLTVLDSGGTPIKLSRAHATLLEATRDAARLVDLPPSDLHPTALAREARDQLRGVDRIRVKEIRGAALLEAKLGGIHAVGRTAVEPPRLLHFAYAPPRPKGPRIALVGKGITYDTGGLHVKGRGAMEGMKGDMGGAAAVLGGFRAAIATKPQCRIDLVLCIAENAIGPDAYKPDDVIRMHSGRTVEINNTDAEGRLLLADGCSYAARNLRADVLLDAATLTGAQMIATGLQHAAVISNDAELEALLVEAGRTSGDLVHPLPFAPEFYRSEFESPIADMRNSVKNRMNAQTSCAAEFVHWHIADTEAVWGHIDLAGPASREERGTGFGVGLIAETIERLVAARV